MKIKMNLKNSIILSFVSLCISIGGLAFGYERETLPQPEPPQIKCPTYAYMYKFLRNNEFWKNTKIDDSRYRVTARQLSAYDHDRKIYNWLEAMKEGNSWHDRKHGPALVIISSVKVHVNRKNPGWSRYYRSPRMKKNKIAGYTCNYGKRNWLILTQRS